MPPQGSTGKLANIPGTWFLGIFLALTMLSILGCFILAPDPTTTLSGPTITAFVVGCILTTFAFGLSLNWGQLIRTSWEALVVIACGGRLAVLAVDLLQRRWRKRKSSSVGPLPIS